jgi:uncharacterized membrane protein YkvA (DUF1232 family)
VLPSGKLLLRLVLDDRVPTRTRLLALGAVAYALVPIDVIPDSIPFLGKIDDVGFAAIAIVRLVGDAGPEVVRQHWDGDEATLEAFLGAIRTLESLIPDRVKRLVALVER